MLIKKATVTSVCVSARKLAGNIVGKITLHIKVWLPVAKDSGEA